MRLLGTKVAVKQEVSASTTKGGLALPDTMKQKLPQGEVVCVGHHILNRPDTCPEWDACVAVGDHVLFNNFAVQAVTVDGQDYAIIDVTDIQVIL